MHCLLVVCVWAAICQWLLESTERFMRQVKRSITICATIHCPPQHTFLLFDRALIMQRGSLIYFGRNGAPCQSYFANCGKVGMPLMMIQ